MHVGQWGKMGQQGLESIREELGLHVVEHGELFSILEHEMTQ